MKFSERIKKSIRICNDDKYQNVDTYIFAKKNSSYAERSAWTKTITNTFGLNNFLTVAYKKDNVTGFAQVFVNRNLTGGRHAVSCPLSSSGGGVQFDNDESLHLILDDLESFTRKRNLDYTQLRLQQQLNTKNWHCESNRYVTFIMDLGGGEEQVWSKVFRAKTRNQIRKGQSHNFEIRSGHDCVDLFCDVLHKGVKELGSPAPGRRLFEEAIRHFGRDVDFLLLLEKGRPISGTVLFFHNDVVANPWAVTLRAYRRSCANSLLYWEIVRCACRRGMNRFDLGRSLKNAGTYHFKRRLGARETPLFYYYYLHRKRQVPMLDTSSGIQRYFSPIWQRLPDTVTKYLGSRLLKELI